MLSTDLLSKLTAPVLFPHWLIFNMDRGAGGFLYVYLVSLLCWFFWDLGRDPRLHAIIPYTHTLLAGAAGNMMSYLWGPPGVLDFIPIGNLIIANFADLCLWVGAFGTIVTIARIERAGRT